MGQHGGACSCTSQCRARQTRPSLPPASRPGRQNYRVRSSARHHGDARQACTCRVGCLPYPCLVIWPTTCAFLGKTRKCVREPDEAYEAFTCTNVPNV